MNKYGICFLSVIPLRSESSDKSEIVSQLLFGDAFTLLETAVEGKWTKIRNAFDNYEGWIDSKHVNELSPTDFEAIKNSKSYLVADTISKLKKDGIEIPVFIGTPLPLFKDGFCEVGGRKYEYSGKIAGISQNTDFNYIKENALRYLNAPYLWGGKSLFGIDCSGFVQQVFRLSGYDLPRDAYQQAEIGTSVNITNQIPGDVAFFSNANGRITHVGIIIEDSQVIHASGQVRIDILDEKGIYNREKNDYSHKFHSIKRFLA